MSPVVSEAVDLRKVRRVWFIAAFFLRNCHCESRAFCGAKQSFYNLKVRFVAKSAPRDDEVFTPKNWNNVHADNQKFLVTNFHINLSKTRSCH